MPPYLSSPTTIHHRKCITWLKLWRLPISRSISNRRRYKRSNRSNSFTRNISRKTRRLRCRISRHRYQAPRSRRCRTSDGMSSYISNSVTYDAQNHCSQDCESTFSLFSSSSKVTFSNQSNVSPRSISEDLIANDSKFKSSRRISENGNHLSIQRNKKRPMATDQMTAHLSFSWVRMREKGRDRYFKT